MSLLHLAVRIKAVWLMVSSENLPWHLATLTYMGEWFVSLIISVFEHVVFFINSVILFANINYWKKNVSQIKMMHMTISIGSRN